MPSSRSSNAPMKRAVGAPCVALWLLTGCASATPVATTADAPVTTTDPRLTKTKDLEVGSIKVTTYEKDLVIMSRPTGDATPVVTYIIYRPDNPHVTIH